MPSDPTESSTSFSLFVQRANPQRLLHKAERELDGADVLSDEIKLQLDTEALHHECLRKVFFEAFNDWDEAIGLLRGLCSAVNGSGNGNMEHWTLKDDGIGSTGKGTFRALCETVLGTYTGGQQNGYCCVITHAALLPPSRGEVERPSEQWSNLRGCCMCFCDDFTATAAVPLSTAKLRQISGLNNLTVARKNKPEETFIFHGTLYLLVNGQWVGDQPVKGADMRRVNGCEFTVSFQNEPVGPNQLLKDKAVKQGIVKMAPELIFLVMCYHYIKPAHEAADSTLPRPPSAAAIRTGLTTAGEDCDIDGRVCTVAKNCLMPYTLGAALPASAVQIDTKIREWLGQIDVARVRTAM